MPTRALASSRPAWCFSQLLLASCCVLIAAAAGEPVPVSDLFRSPLADQVTLSPNGDYFAALAVDQKGHQGLLIYDLKSGQSSGLRGDHEYDVESYQWLDDDRLPYRVSVERMFAMGVYSARRANLNEGSRSIGTM